MDLHEKVPSFLVFDSLESSSTIGVRPSNKEEKIALLEWRFEGCFGFLFLSLQLSLRIMIKVVCEGFPNVVDWQLVDSTNLLL